MQFVVPSESSGRDAPWTTVLPGLLVFLTCFLLTCFLLAQALGRPSTSLLGAKLDLYEQDAQGYDVAFLGPSTTYRQIDPGVFDATMAQGGRPVRSFNLGAPAMGGLEIRFALSQLLEIHPGRLRWLFIDLRVLDLEVQKENLLSGRVTWWHDLYATIRAVRMVLDLGKDLKTTRDLIIDHLRSWAYNLTNLGRLRFVLEQRLAGTEADRRAAERAAAESAVWELGPAADGFCSLEDAVRLSDEETKAPLLERRGAFLRRLDEFRSKALAKARRGGGGSRRVLRETERELLVDMVATAEAAGVSVVFITSPDVDPMGELLQAAADEGLLPAFFDFGDVAAYRELFDPDLRYDWNHLAAAGAEVYSRLLAERLLTLMDSRGSPR